MEEPQNHSTIQLKLLKAFRSKRILIKNKEFNKLTKIFNF
jgi:hypothetical protein